MNVLYRKFGALYGYLPTIASLKLNNKEEILAKQYNSH